jgi:circadian clock protein KaiC
VMVMSQSGLIGQAMSAPVDISYVADTVMLTRYFEAAGRVRKALSVIKKRTGRHEDTIRELTLSSTGLSMGEPLVDFRGVLTGVPEFRGASSELAPGR